MSASVDADAYRDLFAAEARELLDVLEDGITRIISDPQADADQEALFRAAHSLKGMAATLGHDAEARLAHALEDHLVRLGAGHPVSAQVLLDAVDALRTSVEAIARSEATPDLEPVITRLQQAATQPDETSTSSPENSPGDSVRPPRSPETPDTNDDPPTSSGSAPDPPKSAAGYVPPSVRIDAARLDTILDHTASLRIAQGRLERLLAQALPGRPEYSLSEALEHLERATHTLYAETLQLRTLPASVVTRPLMRRARQTAHRHEKQVRLVVEGEATHLDRSLLDALGDPLVHLLTNAVVHGIETPDERERAGKPREGTVHVRLRLDGNLLHVEVQDDGQGIDLDTVRERAVAQGHLNRDDADALDPRGLVSVITRPGFTTTTRLSEEAGRGVGLDAVADAVHRVGGQLHLETEPGSGTTITLTLPPTLSLIEILPVTVASQAYAVPAETIRQVVHLNDADIETGHVRVDPHDPAEDTSPWVRIHRLDPLLGLTHTSLRYPVEEGDQAPIVQQARRIKQATQNETDRPGPFADPRSRYRVVKRDLDPASGTHGPAGLLVDADGEPLVLAVDSCGPPEQAIVKPLHLPTGTPQGATGAIIMRDGRVAIVLDPHRILPETPATQPKNRTRVPP